MRARFIKTLAASAVLLVANATVIGTAIGQTVVFSSDLNSAIPAEVTPGTAFLTGVQGYAGLGPSTSQFGGSFLRSPTGNVVTLSLTSLPAHNAITLDFLFAAIDSLDGSGSFPQGDYFKITLDGVTVFRESFANALPSQVQSYIPPPGVELARLADLGFTPPYPNYLDSAYYLGADPTFRDIVHSASTATFTFEFEGPGIQGLDDESWAMENLRVSVSAVPEPTTSTMLLLGMGAVGLIARRAARRDRGLSR